MAPKGAEGKNGASITMNMASLTGLQTLKTDSFNQKETENMNTRNIFTKLSIAIALVALVATGAVWQIRRVHAMPTAVEDQARFGMVGLTRGQTLRLNVVNLTQPNSNGQYPPDPCRVVLSFRNDSGQPFNNTLSDSILARTVTLQPGVGVPRSQWRSVRAAINERGRGAWTRPAATASLRACGGGAKWS